MPYEFRNLAIPYKQGATNYFKYENTIDTGDFLYNQPIYKCRAAWTTQGIFTYLETGTYTISCFIKSPIVRTVSLGFGIDNNILSSYASTEVKNNLATFGTFATSFDVAGDNEWHRYSGTVEVTKSGYTMPRFYPRTDDSNYVFFSCLQLELGTEMTMFEGYHSTWYIDNGELKHTSFTELSIPQRPFVNPLPKSVWRNDIEHNDGYPYNLLMPNIEYTPPPEPPIPIKQKEYITIYDLHTEKEKFDTHGLVILTPTICTITEELNGAYALNIEHPIDDIGRWQYIRENNIIKAQGQLFTIRVVKQSWTGSKGKITATADHIWYQLNDWWIVRGANIVGATVLQLFRSASNFTEKHNAPYNISYTFRFNSDIIIPDLWVSYAKWLNIEQGMTPNEFILGSDGVIETVGGELYRDNFYFSVNQRKENTRDNAFELRVGKNIQGITRTIDISTMCTWFTGYDNYGNWVSISYSTDDVMGRIIPHNIVREKKFQYDLDGTPTPAETAMHRLERDVLNYHERYNVPLICYEVKLKDLRKVPEYEGFINYSEFKVGNSGTIYDEKLNEKITLKITKTVTNAITGEVEEVTFGKKRGLVSSANQAITVIDLDQTILTKFFRIRDADGAFVLDADGNEIIEEV